jgi:maleylacetate reductase
VLSPSASSLSPGSPSSPQVLLPHTALAPWLIVCDGALSLHTPDALWLSSGMSAVSHAADILAAPHGTITPDVESCAEDALRILLRGLLRAGEDGPDALARADLHVGAWKATRHIARRVHAGGSQTVARALATATDVPYGLAACVALPAVLTFNAGADTGASTQRQVRLAALLASIPEVAALMATEHLGDGASAAEIFDAVLRMLRLPRSLRDVGIQDASVVRDMAELVLQDPCAPYSTVPLESEAQVMKLLSIMA